MGRVWPPPEATSNAFCESIASDRFIQLMLRVPGGVTIEVGGIPRHINEFGLIEKRVTS